MTTVTEKGTPMYLIEVPGSTKAVIVIQEWWGLNDQVKRMTKRYSEALNCTALTIDFYRGKVAKEADEAKHLLDGLDWQQAVADIEHAAAFLKSQGVAKVGAVGFCMGGALVIAAASLLPEGTLAAGVPFYGVPPTSLCDPVQVKCPMQYHFGDLDTSHISSKELATTYKADLAAAGKDVSEFHQHPDADHAWMNEEAPAYPYNEALATKTFDMSVKFFARELAA